MNYYCYILSNKNRTLLYVGSTNNLEKRIKVHKSGNGANFTRKYNVFDLIYFEIFSDNKTARKRERQLKNWHKEWKWNFVKKNESRFKNIRIRIKRP
ncbi:GIY-YIG nuclease family protein [Polaribacter marinus]|nr:GIY-YIG nuclease family protein [Polaribacter marinus]